MDLLLAIDLGTSALKFTAYDPGAGEIESSSQFHPTLTPRTGWREQDPEALADKVRNSLDTMFAALPEENLEVGLSFSGAMHSLLAVDEHNNCLCNAILWSDNRAHEIAKRLRTTEVGRKIYQKTGVPIHPMSPLLKLIWLKEQHPGIFNNAACFLGLKEFVWSRLMPKSGWVMDHAMASATGLMNLESLTWDPLALELVGIHSTRLPKLVPVTHTVKKVWSPSLKVTGILGASDGALANMGAGAMAEGELALSLGTSGAVRQVLKTPFLDPQMRTFCYRMDETHFIAGGASNNGLNALYWFWNKVLGREWNEDALFEALSAIAPGADGLTCLPYLLGERAPWWEGRPQGAFYGLKDSHTADHMLRAVMEGVLYHLKSIADILAEKHPYHKVILAGGGGGQMLLADIIAPMFGKPTVVPQLEDASSIGALRLACKALALPAINTGSGAYEVFPDWDENPYAGAERRFHEILQHLQPLF